MAVCRGLKWSVTDQGSPWYFKWSLHSPEHGVHQGLLPQGAHAHEVPILFSTCLASKTEHHVPKADYCLTAKRCFSISWGRATQPSGLRSPGKCLHHCTKSGARNLSALRGGCKEHGTVSSTGARRMSRAGTAAPGHVWHWVMERFSMESGGGKWGCEGAALETAPLRVPFSIQVRARFLLGFSFLVLQEPPHCNSTGTSPEGRDGFGQVGVKHIRMGTGTWGRLCMYGFPVLQCSGKPEGLLVWIWGL